MCFSNLPVEFDEDGDPYLAEEAEAVERPASDGSVAGDCDAGADAETGLANDPEGAYEAIVTSLPAVARRQIEANEGDGTDARRTESAPGPEPTDTVRDGSAPRGASEPTPESTGSD